MVNFCTIFIEQWVTSVIKKQNKKQNSLIYSVAFQIDLLHFRKNQLEI